jgi:hypothetical protein
MPKETIHIGGQEVTVEPVEPRPGGGARVDVEADDRTWRVDVRRSGSIDEVVTTWRDGELEDLEQPDWLEDVLARMARAA